MRKILFLLFSLVGLLSCQNVEQEEEIEFTPNSQKENDVKLEEFKDFESRVKHHVEKHLDIPANENYDLVIYKEHLTKDGVLDAIITVNRLEHAIKRARNNNVFQKQSELDFFGDFNCIFYYDSELDKIAPPLFITSSSTKPLKISFVHLQSDIFKDVVVDYPIRNSEFRRYYPIIAHTPIYVFQWKKYDGWGTEKLESYCFKYSKGTMSPFKDILIYQGKMDNLKPNENYNKKHPEIDCTEELVHRFFYNPRDQKYYTKKNDAEH